ncbi:developmentally-regulated GTP-binding protein 1-like [Octopus sinensis]|uniref:Developmentally-regulated GTP-binding protein 1-like n=1 Tax=Octopus sinensis TaxID=2607531 RepID=A0A6P7U0X7_9MOLL|nr:developmentally-regulated GTP-binding protein 1-like [Octopus sinensis]
MSKVHECDDLTLPLSSEKAKELFRKNGIILLLNPPKETEIGINCKSWVTTLNFMGFKMVPDGNHFIYYNIANKHGDSSSRKGFFVHITGNMIICKKWDSKNEDLYKKEVRMHFETDIGFSINLIISELNRTQKNKATMHHICMLKARQAKLKRELLDPKGCGGSSNHETFEVAKTGDSRVGFVGFPSVGKSTLLSNLSGVYSKVAEYEFTTLTTVPGVIRYKGAKIQLLDLPGIIEGANDGKGRGRQVISVARTCMLIFVVLDVTRPLEQKKIIERELEGFGIRLNKSVPPISFRKKEKGGINYKTMVDQSELDLETVTTLLAEYKICHADILLKGDCSLDDLIDIVEGNRTYIPCIYVLNKIDKISIQLDLVCQLPNCVPISSENKWNFDELLQTMWEKLGLVRIAFVWGNSVKHQPQKCGKEHVLCDEDVVQLVKKL